MTSEEQGPDHTDAGGGRDVGQGLPEEQPGGASPQGESPAKSGSGAPDSDADADGGPSQATGNRDAAG